MSNPMAPTAPNSSVSWVQPAFLSLSLCPKGSTRLSPSLQFFFFQRENK